MAPNKETEQNKHKTEQKSKITSWATEGPANDTPQAQTLQWKS